MKLKNKKTIILMSLLHFTLLSLLSVTVSQLTAISLACLAFWLLVAIMNYYFYSLALSDPGFIHAPDDDIVYEENSSLKDKPENQSFPETVKHSV